MIIVFFWNKGTEGRKWNVKQYYHVENELACHCWEAHGLDYLRLNPYVEPSRHRSKLDPEQRRRRRLIICRKAALEQDKRQLDKTAAGYADRVAAIDCKILDLVITISEVGGVPYSWAEDLLK